MRLRTILRYGFLIASMFTLGVLSAIPGRLLRLQREFRGKAGPVARGQAPESPAGTNARR